MAEKKNDTCNSSFTIFNLADNLQKEKKKRKRTNFFCSVTTSVITNRKKKTKDPLINSILIGIFAKGG